MKANSGVSFYVQRSLTYSTAKTVIPWQVEVLNIGNGLDLASGVFTVPIIGRYHFTFNSQASAGNSIVSLRVNGVKVAGSGGQSYNEEMPITATLNLQKGDFVDTWLFSGSIHSGNYLTQFSGILLDDDLLL